MLGQSKRFWAILEQVWSGYVLLCLLNSGQDSLRHVSSGYVNLVQFRPV